MRAPDAHFRAGGWSTSTAPSFWRTRATSTEAITLYEKIAAERPELRPELHQALGQLYLLTERPGRARSHFVQARAGYVDSVRRGGVHYFHHLADFYSEAMVDGARAVDWARRDLALRENFSTQAALAWALLCAGQAAEAIEWMDRALASRRQGCASLRAGFCRLPGRRQRSASVALSRACARHQPPLEFVPRSSIGG